MAFTANTGDQKVTRCDIFLVVPRPWWWTGGRTSVRNGEEPPVDEALIELAKDMMPKKGQGDTEGGSSGQLNPILTRPLPDRRLEVVGGFRRMRAALWLIESGTVPRLQGQIHRLPPVRRRSGPRQPVGEHAA